MLYDEEGRAYVEPPLIPEDKHLAYIVGDYQRMYKENEKLRGKLEKMRENLRKLSGYNYFLVKKVNEHEQAIHHAVREMKKKGIIPTPYLNVYIKERLVYNK